MNRPVNVDRLFIRKLSPTHDRLDFDCGNVHLNRYLKKQANQDIKRKISQVFIASPETHQEKKYGFYTLSSLSIQLDSLPEKLAKKLPRHPVPTALIGRLACDVRHKGEGIYPNCLKILDFSGRIKGFRQGKLKKAWLFSVTAPALLYLLHPCSRHVETI